MTDGTERITDLVGNAGGQAAERGQFQLLCLLGDLGNVFEEYQRVLLGTALKGNEAGLQHRPAFGRLEVRGAQCRIAQPLFQALNQVGAVGIENPSGQFLVAEQVEGALVGQDHAVLVVEHQNASSHALENQRVERFQIGDIRGALFGERLSDLEAARDALHEQRGGKAERAKCAGLQILAGDRWAADAQVEHQVDHRNAGHGGDQQADTPAEQDVGDGHCDDEQVADTAGRPASGIEERGQQDHVHQCQAEYLRDMLRALDQHRKKRIDAEVEPTAVSEQLFVKQVEQLIVQFAGDQQHQREADAEPVEVIEAQHSAALLATQRQSISAHRR